MENNTFIRARCATEVDSSLNTVGIKLLGDSVGPWPVGTSNRNIIRNNVFRDWEPRSECEVPHNPTGYDTLTAIWCDVDPSLGEVSGNIITNVNPGDRNVGTGASTGMNIEAGCVGWVIKNNVVSNVGYFGMTQRTTGDTANPDDWPTPPTSG